MCIALFSTAHPSYPLILINNRDEYLNRPTAPAHWWEAPHGHVLGGRDLQRKEQGTWLGMTKQGRIAILTNFREDGVVPLEGKSRGAMVNAFLTEPAGSAGTTQSFIEDLVEGGGLEGVGGFSLVCGKIGEPLAVISNRTPDVEGITWIAKKEETVGLSNAAFAERSWPKVLRGEELLASAIDANIKDMAPQASLREKLFSLLSDDTLPKRPTGMGWHSYVKELANSIFIPPIGGEGADHLSSEDITAATSDQAMNVENQAAKAKTGDIQSGIYATQKQTVVIVDHAGKVTFVERTLYDENGRPVAEAERDRRFDFLIEGWGERAMN